MGLALNLIALLMVIGLSWAAMIWMSGRFHGERRSISAEQFRQGMAASGEADSGHPETSRPDQLLFDSHRANECATCNGSGAKKNQGRLTPCPSCEGTGVLA